MKRLVDLILTLVAVLLLLLPVIIVAVLVKLTSKGPVLYWSDRVGKNNAIFKMPKFRSMIVDTPVVATHLLADPKSLLTPVGDFLRKSSLDELPQLWCILKGDMSFVGPPEFDSLKTKRPFFRQIRTCLLGCRPFSGKNRVLAFL